MLRVFYDKWDKLLYTWCNVGGFAAYSIVRLDDTVNGYTGAT